MLAAVGAGAYASREDVPELTSHGQPLIQPLRVASAYTVAEQDVDPRGLPVMGGDGKQGGTVKDIWIGFCRNDVPLFGSRNCRRKIWFCCPPRFP
jgi:photosynthetic reaction center H subunit